LTRKTKALLFTLVILGWLSVSTLDYAYAEDTLEQSVIIALGTATTQVQEAEVAAGAVATLVPTAITEAQQAQQASVAVECHNCCNKCYWSRSKFHSYY